MSILKITCPHCNFTYVLPENKIPSGELTVTCQNCKQTYVYTKPGANPNLKGPMKGGSGGSTVSSGPERKAPEVENRPFYRQASAPGLVTPREEPKKDEEKSSFSWQTVATKEEPKPSQPASETSKQTPAVEEKNSFSWHAVSPKEEPKPVQQASEPSNQTMVVEDNSSPTWQPVASREEPKPVQQSSEPSNQAMVVEDNSSPTWQPVASREEPKLVQQASEPSKQTMVVEDNSSPSWQPVPPREELQTPVKAPQETPTIKKEAQPEEKPKQVQGSAGATQKASVTELKPSPVSKPVKKVIKKRTAGAKRGSRTKWIIAAAAVSAIAIIASVVLYKPAVATRAKEMSGILSEKIKENASEVVSRVNEKLEPPIVIEPSEPSIDIAPEAAIVRPPKFHEIAGSWTGRLTNDKKGLKWTFSFNQGNYDVSIKNDSGLWIKGTAMYQWDQGTVGDSLRVKPRWNVLDIDVIKSSVSDYAGKKSLGAFLRVGNNAKLCMSRPGSMIEPTENSSEDVQCFDLKKNAQ